MNMILCGLPASGKTTLGKMLAEKLDWNFIDTDRLLEKAYAEKTGSTLSCRQIYSREGEIQFRLLERQQIVSLQGAHKSVIAVGGGSLIDKENTKLLQSLGFIIYLQVPLSVLWDRLCQKEVPAFLDTKDPENGFYAMANKRIPLYENAAHATIATKDLSEEEILKALLKEVKYGK